ncbi:hypothetical protein [Paraburkholderia saeva]|uniref:hypothetical protein n=1 Tax=Paraburkholderia saeva TaxID=2777537 RepID=UPI001E299912|nr:hypothetical protein [Paraburkholderia saeva]
MIEKLVGMLGTDDLTEWETSFVQSLQRRLADGQVTALTERQVETLDRLHNNHFA